MWNIQLYFCVYVHLSVYCDTDCILFVLFVCLSSSVPAIATCLDFFFFFLEKYSLGGDILQVQSG